MFEVRKKYTIDIFLDHDRRYTTQTNNLVAAFNVFTEVYLNKYLKDNDSTEILITVDKN